MIKKKIEGIKNSRGLTAEEIGQISKVISNVNEVISAYTNFLGYFKCPSPKKRGISPAPV